MPIRLAACDPCRLAKVSCDHDNPCGRCRESARDCTYRQRPFKRRRAQEDNPNKSVPPARLIPNTLLTNSPITTPREANIYPNPGYQGLSSHISIFDQVKASGGAVDGLEQAELAISDQITDDLGDYEAARHATLLEDIKHLDVNACTELVRRWISQGVNLALAGPLVMSCVESVGTLFSTRSGAQLVAALFRSSRRRLSSDGAVTISTFCEMFCRSETGWATLGVFLVALSRAAEDATFPHVYTTRAGEHRLQKIALQYADQCLEICLSLDCLNDLQLILQYESFIAHSMIDGDQSYHSWRRLGDVVSSLYALGYHERVDLTALNPVTLNNLRSAAFCRTYSADKNVSIFLGRPPRMHRKHSSLRLSPQDIAHLFSGASSNDDFKYAQETRWTVACAILKERVLDLARLDNEAARTQESCAILQDCESLDASLPPRYHLTGHLKNFQGSAVERDFVASAALNITHVRFLLHSSFMQRTSGPSSQLINTSATILKLTAEVAVLKSDLANSGTGFIWKIVFYGLPAAGIVCLALINRIAQRQDVISQSVQDLSVLVAHVEGGVLLSPDQPNYALVQAAIVTIKSVLQKLTVGMLSQNTLDESSAGQTNGAPDLWMPWTGGNDFLDFELDFWTSLAEHPALYQDTA